MPLSPPTPGRGPTVDDLQAHRAALTGHCYRMLGSVTEAEDAVQDTLVRAWRGLDRYEGRASLRSWLYRIATRVCLDALAERARRARPVDLGPAGTIEGPLGDPLPEHAWVQPIPDDRALPVDADPAELLALRQSIRLAFVAALQRLAPRQRAVLLLREVLDLPAAEVADTLDTSVASVNSALQRARTTLAARDATPSAPPDPALLGRYVDAFERYDLDALTALLHEEVALSMPPYPLWLRGHDSVRGWLLGTGIGCRGSRLLPTRASGAPAFGQYRPAPGGGHLPWSLIVLDIVDDRIVGMCHFLDTEALFPLFGLPPALPR